MAVPMANPNVDVVCICPTGPVGKFVGDWGFTSKDIKINSVGIRGGACTGEEVTMGCEDFD